METRGPHFKSLPEIEGKIDQLMNNTYTNKFEFYLVLLPSMQDFFYLLNILPQVVAGKSSANIQRDRFSMNKILVFRTVRFYFSILRT